MTYNGYGIKTISKLFELGKEFKQKDMNTSEVVDALWELGYQDVESLNIVSAGMNYGDRIGTIEERTYYRIGEPIVDSYGSFYKNSYNYAEDRPEIGISVVTENWMNSLKSVFFGAHDNEKLKAKGIYKIKGVQIGFGGDDEPIIYATDWAEKTKITTVNGLMKAIKG